MIWVNGEEVKTSRSGDVLRLDSAWWKPGTITVQAVAGDRTSRKVTAEVPRGGPAAVAIDFGDSEPTSSEPQPEQNPDEPSIDTGGRGVPTATWITGGIGVAGLATFALFGSMAKSKSSDLESCAPSCPESERSTADAGKRDQTIANVGLVVGGVGLAAAAGFFFLQPSPSEQEAGTVDVAVGPQSIVFRGRFQ